MKLYTPNLKAVRFIAKFDKKLFEIGGRKLLTLKADDVVIVTELQALLLLRQPHFEAVDIDTLFVNETKVVLTDADAQADLDGNPRLDNPSAEALKLQEALKDDEEQDEYKLPFAEDLESLTLDEVKLACDFVGVTKGNKGIDKLKALLLPHLPKKEQ